MNTVANVMSARVVAYARYSSDAQRAASIDDQLRNCRKRADAEGWTIAETFADRAISGSDANRPEYQRMLAAAGRGEFDVLLVDDLSRLARDSVEAERTIRRLEFQGLRLLAVTDGYDSHAKTATRKIQRGVKNLINEMRLDELREQVHRGLAGQAIKRFWCGGKPYGFKLKPILDPTQRDPYGQPARIGTVLEIDPPQAEVVREIFTRHGEGASCHTIARELNMRGVPSPGSTWKRKVRRASGWMQSAVRVVLLNPLYTGRVRWNVSQFVRDPDTGKEKRRRRPESEWHEFRDESLRIVSDEAFAQSQTRRKSVASDDPRLRTGGKSKYLLSGLLRCKACGANYVLADARSYACSGHVSGGACSNKERIRRDTIEAAILDPIRRDLLAPERVARMAAELQLRFAERMREQAGRAERMPNDLRELVARIERLRARLKSGDPDMTTDELQAAIDKAEQKRRELESVQPEAKRTARVLAALPQAASIYRQQISLGLDGDPRAAQKARHVLKDMLGQIALEPDEAGGLWAEYGIKPAALLKVAGAGSSGRGDRI